MLNENGIKFFEELKTSDKAREIMQKHKAPANADEAAALCEHFSIIPNAAVAKKALPGSQLCFVAGEDMKTQIAPFYQILFDYNPAAVGGKLPDDAFYFAK